MIIRLKIGVISHSMLAAVDLCIVSGNKFSLLTIMAQHLSEWKSTVN